MATRLFGRFKVSGVQGMDLMAENNTLIEFQNKFRTEELLVYRNEAWTWSVRPAQPTVGAGVLSLNRFALRLSDVTAMEMGLLADAIGEIESRVESVFNHSVMNYLALMMVDHHVHYHVVPRYGGVRHFAGREWVDNGWPGLPAMPDAQHNDGGADGDGDGDGDGILAEIRDALKAAP